MIPKCYELFWLTGSWKLTLVPETSFPSFHVFLTLDHEDKEDQEEDQKEDLEEEEQAENHEHVHEDEEN